MVVEELTKHFTKGRFRKMKINYTYTEYKDYPEATAISESRERNYPLFTMGAYCALGLGLIFLFQCETLLDWIENILIIALSIAAIVHLRYRYHKVTEEKIRKAIENSIKLKEEIKNSKYLCERIVVHDKCATGTCSVCFSKNVFTRYCEIKTDIGTRTIYTCEECISKFKGKRI